MASNFINMEEHSFTQLHACDKCQTLRNMNGLCECIPQINNNNNNINNNNNNNNINYNNNNINYNNNNINPHLETNGHLISGAIQQLEMLSIDTLSAQNVLSPVINQNNNNNGFGSGSTFQQMGFCAMNNNNNNNNYNLFNNNHNDYNHNNHNNHNKHNNYNNNNHNNYNHNHNNNLGAAYLPTSIQSDIGAENTNSNAIFDINEHTCEHTHTCEACWMQVCNSCKQNHDENKIIDNELIYLDDSKNRIKKILLENANRIKKILDCHLTTESKIVSNVMQASNLIHEYLIPLREILDQMEKSILKQVHLFRDVKISFIKNENTCLQSYLQKIAETTKTLESIQSDMIDEPTITSILNTLKTFQVHCLHVKRPSEEINVNIKQDNGRVRNRFYKLCDVLHSQFKITTNQFIPLGKSMSPCNMKIHQAEPYTGIQQQQQSPSSSSSSSLHYHQHKYHQQRPQQHKPHFPQNLHFVKPETRRTQQKLQQQRQHQAVLRELQQQPDQHQLPKATVPIVPGKCIPDSSKPIQVMHSVNNLFRYFAGEGTECGQVSRPWGLCADKMGNLIISDRRNHRIQIFDGITLNVTLMFGVEGTEPGQFKLPTGVTTTPENDIAVVDKDNHRIQIFSAKGVFRFTFGSQGSDGGKFLYPWAIAANSKGELAVTDSKNGRIQLFTALGDIIYIFKFDNYLCAIDKKMIPCSPRGVTFTPCGNLIVTDFANNTLHVLKRGPSELYNINFIPQHEVLLRPSGIACDDYGNVVIADSKHQRIRVYGPKCEPLFNIDLVDLNIGEIIKDRPADVAILPNGDIAVVLELSPDIKDKFVDRNKPHIVIFSNKEKLKSEIEMQNWTN